MKNILKKLILLLSLIVFPVGVLAEAQFSVTPPSLNIEVGKTKTFTITTADATGSISISSSDNDVALVSTTSYDFEAGSSGQTRNETITVTGVNPGTARITISINATGTDNEELNLNSKIVDVTVKSISTNNYLSDIKINGVTISGFSKTKTTYNIETEESSVIIDATKESSSAKLTGTGQKSLNYGSNKIELKVTAENESVRTYTLNINRKDTRDTNNNLSNLTIDKGTLVFDKSKSSYDVEVESDVDKVTINATTESSKARISGHGLINLKYGINKVELKVTAENESVKVYTININRSDDREANNDLSDLKIDNGTINFDKLTTTYNVEVKNRVDKLLVTATPESEKATVTGSGEKDLIVGDNKIEIKVTAENGNVKTYTLIVKRLEPTPGSDFIEELSIEGIDFEFDPDVNEYTISINDQTSLEFHYTVKDGVVVTIAGNENLKNGSEIVLTASKDDVSIEYVFNISKTEVIENVVVKKPSNRRWIYIAVGVLAVLLLIGTFGKAMDKKKKANLKQDDALETVQNEINSELASTEIIGNTEPVNNQLTPTETTINTEPVNNDSLIDNSQTPLENSSNEFENIEKF